MRYPKYETVERSVLQFHVVAEHPTLKTLYTIFVRNKCQAKNIAAALQTEFLRKNWMIFDKKEDKTFYLWNSDIHSDIIKRDLPAIYKDVLASFNKNQVHQQKSDIKTRISALKEKKAHLDSLQAEYKKEYQSIAKELGPMLDILNAFKSLDI